MLFFDIASIGLILAGSLFSLATAIGLVRFRDTVARMHASTKPQTLGLALTLLGVTAHIIARGGGGAMVAGDMGMMLLVVLFAMMTSPIIGNRLGHVALKEGLIDRSLLSRDDEAGHSKRGPSGSKKGR